MRIALALADAVLNDMCLLLHSVEALLAQDPLAEYLQLKASRFHRCHHPVALYEHLVLSLHGMALFRSIIGKHHVAVTRGNFLAFNHAGSAVELPKVLVHRPLRVLVSRHL